ncbi:hypothetical protein BVRB_4g079420 [Beta vulgaris subsp. vulgaris]|nr:hypothetical protein BVRB_4g079420 [Beta vulgaris subsp. vulgaris]
MSSFKANRSITFRALVYLLLIIFLFPIVLASGRHSTLSLSVSESPVSQSETNGGGGGGGDVLVFGGTAFKIAVPTFVGVLIVILYVLWIFCIKGGCSCSFTYTPKAQTEMTVLGGADSVMG